MERYHTVAQTTLHLMAWERAHMDGRGSARRGMPLFLQAQELGFPEDDSAPAQTQTRGRLG